MASSQTQNLQLIEYGAGSDNFLRTDYNGNLTKIDEFAGKTKDDIETLEEGLAYIVGNTNTTGETLAVGQFVYVKGHSTIPNGLRKVTASISNNASITTSNTSPDTAGGLNTLNSNKANKPIVMDLTATTTSSGAILIPTVVVNGTFLSAWGANTAYFIYRRDPNYFMVRDTILNVVADTEVTIKIAYIPA